MKRVDLSLTTSQAAVLVELVTSARDLRPPRVRVNVKTKNAFGELTRKLLHALEQSAGRERR